MGVKPIPMVLRCPECHFPHVDHDEWATKPHRAHSCAECGAVWKPCDLDTVGVESLLCLPRFRAALLICEASDCPEDDVLREAETIKHRHAADEHAERAAR